MAPSPATSPVALACGAAPAVIYKALANALTDRLEAAPSRVSTPRQTTYEIIRADMTVLAGHLRWRGAGGIETAAPFVNSAVVDGSLTATAYRQFANDLLKVTDLPL